jgi:hypothetical protein
MLGLLTRFSCVVGRMAQTHQLQGGQKAQTCYISDRPIVGLVAVVVGMMWRRNIVCGSMSPTGKVYRVACMREDISKTEPEMWFRSRYPAPPWSLRLVSYLYVRHEENSDSRGPLQFAQLTFPHNGILPDLPPAFYASGKILDRSDLA